MKAISIVALSIALAGCTFGKAAVIAGGITSVICSTTTEEGRADIRGKQNLPTDICGDLAQKEGEQ